MALALLMLVTGSINILSVKYTDKLKSENTAGKLVPFNHPFFQACGMFLGKLLSMVAFPAFYAIKWFRKKHSEQSAAISSGIEDSKQRLEDNHTVPLGDWLEKIQLTALIIKQQFGFSMSTT